MADEVREGFQAPQERTLRDEFAMAALTGFCSMSDSTGMWSWRPDDIGRNVYQIADAMIEARK